MDASQRAGNQEQTLLPAVARPPSRPKTAERMIATRFLPSIEKVGHIRHGKPLAPGEGRCPNFLAYVPKISSVDFP